MSTRWEGKLARVDHQPCEHKDSQCRRKVPPPSAPSSPPSFLKPCEFTADCSRRNSLAEVDASSREEPHALLQSQGSCPRAIDSAAGLSGQTAANRTGTYVLRIGQQVWPGNSEQSCASSYFASMYASLHKVWRSQGRLLFFCSESSGLGAYTYGITSAIIASVLTSRALILSCAVKDKFSYISESVVITTKLSHFFNGRGFDWHPRNLNLSESPIMIKVTSSGYGAEAHFNSTVAGGKDIGERPILLIASEHTGMDKLLGRGAGGRKNSKLFTKLTGFSTNSSRSDPWVLANNMARIMVCALAHIFHPTLALLNLERRTLGLIDQVWPQCQLRVKNSFLYIQAH